MILTPARMKDLAAFMNGVSGTGAHLVKLQAILYSKVSVIFYIHQINFNIKHDLYSNIGRSMKIIREATTAEEGKACPSDTKDWRPCDIPRCDRTEETQDCIYEWGQWSQCPACFTGSSPSE